jgi:glycerol-3-phosphate O-acyltransferase
MSTATNAPPGDAASVLPNPAPGRIVFLIDAASRLERRLLHDWIEDQRLEGSQIDCLEIPCSRRRRGRLDPALEPALAGGDDPLLAPLRVAWLARVHEGRRTARLSDLLKLGDPRDPGWLRERLVLRREPDRCRVVAAEPALASELRERWRRHAATDTGHTVGLAEFVARQAALALDRAERRLRGARYKVPRFVGEDILSRPAFRGEIARAATRSGRSVESLTREAAADLREIAAGHSPFVIDLVVQLWQWLYSRGYGEVLRYDPQEIERVRALSQQHPVVFLPTHKSNLDHGVLQCVLHENGLPPNHTAGGINMNFFPLGPLVRRAGVFFIRRSFKDDEIYKLVLRHYVDFLVEKRFPLEWYIEGGRSRSGKLLPPRFGLLAYVVDAYRRARSEDVQLVPVSICYDQISDVGDYTAEQRGAAKQRESLGWFVGIVRRLGRRYGRVDVRFGEPISLQKTLGPPDADAPPNPDEQSLALQKLAFEVCVQINRATPITPISLVCLALLGRGDRALSRDEMVGALHNVTEYVRRRNLPTTEELPFDDSEGVGRVLDELVESDLLVRYDEGPETVYAIGPEQHLSAAYYRNTVIHFFVTGAIGELALLRAAEDEVTSRRQEFWDEALRLRDLLKFEFFFPDKEVFLAELRQELSLHDPAWEERLDQGAESITAVLPKIRPLSAHRILRPFLEAYAVAADALLGEPADEALDEEAYLRRCLGLGKQYVLQRRFKRQESVSKVLFATALRLARNRELLETGSPELASRRAAFAEEIRQAIRRVDAVEALTRARHAGLLAGGPR